MSAPAFVWRPLREAAPVSRPPARVCHCGCPRRRRRRVLGSVCHRASVRLPAAVPGGRPARGLRSPLGGGGGAAPGGGEWRGRRHGRGRGAGRRGVCGGPEAAAVTAAQPARGTPAASRSRPGSAASGESPGPSPARGPFGESGPGASRRDPGPRACPETPPTRRPRSASTLSSPPPPPKTYGLGWGAGTPQGWPLPRLPTSCGGPPSPQSPVSPQV